MLSAYIHLGHNYEIFALVDNAVLFLEAYFTTNFDVWERFWCRKGKRREAPFTFSKNPAADAIDTVNLARMAGKPSLLPVALYQCCQLDLIESVKRSESEADTQVYSLSSADIALCLRAKERLLKAYANVCALSFLLNKCSAPEFSETCTGRVYGISTSGVLRRLDQDLTTDPLGYAPSMDEESVPQHAGGDVELCWTCRRGMASRVRSARQQIWSELPTYFQLLTLDPVAKQTEYGGD